MIDQASKPQANEALARALARDIPDVYSTPIKDEETGKIIGSRPNDAAYKEAASQIGFGTVRRGEIAANVDLKEELNKAVTSQVASTDYETFVDRAKKGQEPGYEGLSEQQIRDKRKAEITAIEAKKLGISLQASGGQIPSLTQDPPMLDMSSRF